VVSVGMFSWSRLEPLPGEFDFGWLREVLDLLDGVGVAAGLGTPTAAPPPWLTTAYPTVLPVDHNGVRFSHGSRQQFCVNSAAYRRFATRITSELAREFADHPALRFWHVHNEYACHVPACYCDQCAVAFRGWLRSRYGSVESLNEAWGTSFWSQRYGGWDEVLPPRATPTHKNPAQVLDYRRFFSDAYLAEFREERDVLRSIAPDIPVTTNFMGFFEPLDYFRWSPEEDFCSTDNYPDPADPDSPLLSAMHYDLVRSLRRGRRWLLIEQTTLRVNWRPVNSAKVPGEMRRGSYQALARGAAGVCFFQWRASKAGAEKFHSAMLPHAGTASPVWRSVTELGRELASLGELNAADVVADCAVVFSWPNWWALEGPGQPSSAIRMLDQVRWVCRPLYEAGMTADFVPPDADISGYKLVLVPSLYLLTEEQGRNICSYVEQGGTAVISFWSGITNESDQVYLGPYGGPLRPLIGGDVLDVAPLQSGEVVEVAWRDGRRCVGTDWIDIIKPGDGEVLASYAAGPGAGRPAVMEKRLGAGRALYLGTRVDDATISELLLRRLPDMPALPRGVERVIRRADGVSYEFLLNHGAAAAVTPSGDGVDLLSGKPVSGDLALPAGGVAIIRREH